MTRLMRIGIVFLLCTFGISTGPAVAGFLDDMKKKAQAVVGDVSADAKQLSTNNSPNPAADEAKSDGLVFKAEDGSPTVVARSLLVVHFRPELLDDDVWLKKIAGEVDPYRRNWMNTDQFRWRKEKSAIKTELLDQAKKVPTSYVITPWPGREVLADLGQYDFDREAFKMRVHIGSSGAWPWGGDNRVEWLSVPAKIAEQMVTAFNNSSRLVYAGYTLNVVGVEPKGSGRRLYPFFDDRIDKVDVYTLKGSPFPTSPDDFQFRMSLDTHSLRMKDHAGRR